MMAIPDTKTIQVEMDKVTIKSDFDGTERVILLSDPAPAEPAIHGVSHGRFDNGTLHITTDRFLPSTMGLGFGATSSTQKTLKERLTLTDDRRSLIYAFELMDSKNMSQPLSGEVRWSFQPNATLTGLACDPENAARFVRG